MSVIRSTKTTALVPIPSRAVVIRPAIASDEQLIASWLRRYLRVNTREAYGADVRAFRAFVRLPLQEVTEGDIEAYADSIGNLAPSTQSRRLSAVKSLLAFGAARRYLPVDAGADIPLPGIKDTLGQRILAVEDVLKLLLAADRARGPFVKRNATLLRLLYGTGARVSEAAGLRWEDFAPHADGAYMTAYGKGDKTRTVLLPAALWARLMTLRGDAGPNDYVFRSRKGGALSRIQIHSIFKSIILRAGLPGPAAAASPHWLRHAHVSHSLDNGAPVHVVQVSVGHASLTTTTRYSHVRPEDSSARYIRMS